MTVSNLISASTPPLRPSDTVEYGLGLMMELHVRHVPVVTHDNRLAGLLSEEMLLDADSPSTPIGQLLGAEPVAVSVGTHVFDVTKVMMDHDLSLVPVLDAEGPRKSQAPSSLWKSPNGICPSVRSSTSSSRTTREYSRCRPRPTTTRWVSRSNSTLGTQRVSDTSWSTTDTESWQPSGKKKMQKISSTGYRSSCAISRSDPSRTGSSSGLP